MRPPRADPSSKALRSPPFLVVPLTCRVPPQFLSATAHLVSRVDRGVRGEEDHRNCRNELQQILRRSEKVDGELKIREGSLNFRNTQQVATAPTPHDTPRHNVSGNAPRKRMHLSVCRLSRRIGARGAANTKLNSSPRHWDFLPLATAVVPSSAL